MTVKEIRWALTEEDFETAVDLLAQRPVKEAAKILHLKPKAYVKQTHEELVDAVRWVWGHSPITIEDVLDLPQEVTVPEELSDTSIPDYEDCVTEWLCNTYGYYISGYMLDDVA